MSKTTQIKIEITRNVTPMISTENGGEWAMGFHDIEMDFDDGKLIGLMNEKGLTGLFMGEVMKISQGKADPKLTAALLSQKLEQ